MCQHVTDALAEPVTSLEAAAFLSAVVLLLDQSVLVHTDSPVTWHTMCQHMTDVVAAPVTAASCHFVVSSLSSSWPDLCWCTLIRLSHGA